MHHPFWDIPISGPPVLTQSTSAATHKAHAYPSTPQDQLCQRCCFLDLLELTVTMFWRNKSPRKKQVYIPISYRAVLTCRRLHQQLLPLQSHLKGQLALKQLKWRQFRRGCGWDRIGHDKKPWLRDMWRKNNGTHENVSKYKFRCATGAEGTDTGPFGAAGGSSILVNVSLLEGNNWEIATFSNIQQH